MNESMNVGSAGIHDEPNDLTISASPPTPSVLRGDKATGEHETGAKIDGAHRHSHDQSGEG
jgi:hypothetical protein